MANSTKVPLLVCTACLDSGAAEAASARLLCPLCTEGYVPPSQMPTLLEAEAEPSAKRAASEPARANKPGKRLKGRDAPPSTRLFVGSLPLVTDAAAVRKARSTLGHLDLSYAEWAELDQNVAEATAMIQQECEEPAE